MTSRLRVLSFKNRRLVMIRCTLFWIAVSTVTTAVAAEYRGVVKSAGLPIPGATVTATLLDKKFVTTTDDQGAYSFPDLSPGAWTITVEMLGFAKTSGTVDPTKPVPTATWDLRLLSQQALNQQAAPATPGQSAATKPPVPPTPAAQPNSATANANPQTTPRRNRSTQGPNGSGGANASNASRPSLRQAIQSQQQRGYQPLDVNPSQDAQGLQAENTPGQENEFASGDLNQSAQNAFVVNGSVSTGVNAPQQNDWGLFGPGGPGGPGFGPGGPGFGPNGLSAQVPGGPGGPGAPGGPGGPGGGGGGRGGGFGGGGGGFGGGGGGFGGGGGGRFGGGGFGGGRGGRGGVARTANSFGNARRGRRNQYTGNVAVVLDNSALDAKPFSLTGQETPKSSY